MPAVPKSPQPSAAPVSSDDPNSFANYLKSVASHQSEEQTDQSSTSSRLSTATKDKTGKDSQKNEDDKKKPLSSDSTPVPVPVTPAADAKPFQLSWSFAKTDARNEGRTSGSSAADAADAASDQDLKSSALKKNVSEAVAEAPVAFGANLSNADVLRAEGLKAEDPKADGMKTQDAKIKPSSNEAAVENSAADISKAAESKNSSGKQQQEHSDSSQDDPSSASGATTAKVSNAATASQLESLSALHASAAPPSNQAPIAASPVQNGYTSAPAATVEKTAPVAPTAPLTEPPSTPALRPQNIDLKIAGADNSQVDVRISQRAGDVQVTVRTPDGDLAQSLRQHLPELSDRLSQSGVSGDLWQPQTAQAANTGGNDADSRYSDDAQTQQQGQQQQHPKGNSHHGNQQQETDTPQATWLKELNQAEKETK